MALQVFSFRRPPEKAGNLGARGDLSFDDFDDIVEAADSLEIGKKGLHILKLFLLDGEHIKCEDCESRQK